MIPRMIPREGKIWIRIGTKDNIPDFEHYSHFFHSLIELEWPNYEVEISMIHHFNSTICVEMYSHPGENQQKDELQLWTLLWKHITKIMHFF